jgi:fructose-1,6-bisphosphatase/inositol monophosphatase family enzyme
VTTNLPSHPLLPALQLLHRMIRDAVVASTERAVADSLSRVAHDDEGDTIYAIDKVAEDVLVEAIDRTIAREDGPVVLVAEGLPGGQVVLPAGARAANARWAIIVDPIDGTRGLMYQKRPAWILTGVARVAPLMDARGSGGAGTVARDSGGPPAPTLADIELALQTEIPLVKQHLCDELWAVRGQGAVAQRVNRLTGDVQPLALRPSTATNLAHGFATISRFFPGNATALAGIDDEVAVDNVGPPERGKAKVFEDQYISTGGQLYELMVGHDRFIADLRSLADHASRAADAPPGDGAPRMPGTGGLCCHPYDLCAELIARELGVLVTDPYGAPLCPPLDVHADVSWVGYANAALRAAVEPSLRAALTRRHLL